MFVNLTMSSLPLFIGSHLYFQYYFAFVYLSEFIIVLCFSKCHFTNKTFTTHGTQVFIVERQMIDLFLWPTLYFQKVWQTLTILQRTEKLWCPLMTVFGNFKIWKGIVKIINIPKICYRLSFWPSLEVLCW